MSTTEDPAPAAELLKATKDEAVEVSGMLESTGIVSDDASTDSVKKATLVGGARTVRDVATEGEMGKYPVRSLELKLPFFQEKMKFNWFVTIFGLIVLWGLAGYCMAQPAAASAALSTGFNWVVDYFTWFYIAANPVLTFFIVWLGFRYGHIKLGPKDAEPEFSNSSYFAMIFSAGVGVGLFFYGVSEPLFHREKDNYYSNAGYHSQNEIDQWSLVITMYHWGLAAWSPYLVVAIATGLGTYRFGLPMTIRSTFYPILGDYCWGWMGDLIDAISLVMTVAGVCTSLGLGAIQMVAGLQRLGWVDPDREDLQMVYVALICIITLCATASVVSGLAVGIKILANIAFGLGCFILFLCFAMEKSRYILDLLFQTTGVYLQWNIFQVPFWTDAFGSLEEGSGRAIDGNSAAEWWIGSWTVFYLAWWVAWACFVGMFIARISRNRTIGNIIVSVFIAPTLYSLLWFCCFGGIGLRQQRQALELEQIGSVSFDDPGHYLAEGSGFCYDVPQDDVVVNGTTVFTNHLLGITPVCTFNRADSTQAWFNVMYSFSYPDANDFGGFGPFLSGFSIFTLALYFITSSDSGSLVVDILASNGATEHHWIQRVFWALTEGAVACALLVAGDSDALSALQSASIIFGLPFNLFLFLMCFSIVQMCKAIEAENNPDHPHPDLLLPKKTWTMPVFGGVFNIFEFIISFGRVHEARKEKGMDLPTSEHTVEFFKALLLPFVSMYKIYNSSVINPKQKQGIGNMMATAAYTTCFIGWVALFVCGLINDGFVALAWSIFFVNGIILTTLRMQFRERLGIRGNVIGDFCLSSFLYPQVLAQMVVELNGNSVSVPTDGKHVN